MEGVSCKLERKLIGRTPGRERRSSIGTDKAPCSGGLQLVFSDTFRHPVEAGMFVPQVRLTLEEVYQSWNDEKMSYRLEGGLHVNQIGIGSRMPILSHVNVLKFRQGLSFKFWISLRSKFYNALGGDSVDWVASLRIDFPIELFKNYASLKISQEAKLSVVKNVRPTSSC
ncbi:hypothetical protein Tco_0484037 [Tanacetum coccineum]